MLHSGISQYRLLFPSYLLVLYLVLHLPLPIRFSTCFLLFLTGYLFDLLLDPDNGKSMLLRNIKKKDPFLQARTSLRHIPNDNNLHRHRCKNLKSNQGLYIFSKICSLTLHIIHNYIYYIYRIHL
jgi:hypothetical protein